MADDELEKQLARLNRSYSLEYEMIRATAAFERAALRPLFLLNGGALIAYLALFTGLGQSGIDISFGKFAFGGWALGLVCATFCAFFGVRSQFKFRRLRGRQADHAETIMG